MREKLVTVKEVHKVMDEAWIEAFRNIKSVQAYFEDLSEEQKANLVDLYSRWVELSKKLLNTDNYVAIGSSGSEDIVYLFELDYQDDGFAWVVSGLVEDNEEYNCKIKRLD